MHASSRAQSSRSPAGVSTSKKGSGSERESRTSAEVIWGFHNHLRFSDGRGAGMVERSKQRVRSVSPPRNLTPEEKVAKQHALAAEGKVEEIVPGIESWLRRTGKILGKKETRRRRPVYSNIVVTITGESQRQQRPAHGYAPSEAGASEEACSSLLHCIRNLSRKVEQLGREGVISMHFILTRLNVSEWKELAEMPVVCVLQDGQERQLLIQKELATRLAMLQAAVDEVKSVQTVRNVSLFAVVDLAL
ncbi:hypothetical protein GUITHDRAFT_108474 [Guillardia theta CCMP2712]|uniref:Uncharacterized protein n=1 Tax=Guillardia theta (strain CCMP2712) TaxID=905079 RepID=L1JBX5_GUITC|nr:hypothetical protein GUITHDRAFT_108474 [Guillardia theta CCMP2712]EKX45600.1 hypothetical protein GUITHDRAFT_108474 [Guillardia theta CCMP2712]|eukprot:XP_005832580.1 hypothetical protein GUITHDRAFT_108474 [Guillardia theta CCMP2712]